jgi:hypothetical protein
MTIRLRTPDPLSNALRKAFPLVLVAAVLGVLGGCDAAHFRSDEDGSGTTGEVQADGDAFERADLQFESVSLAPGETFSIGLTDTRYDRPVIRITHEGNPDGSHSLSARFAPLQPTSVTVQCRNESAGTTKTMSTLSPSKFNSQGGVDGVAITKNGPDSYHYTETDGNVVVEVDYEEQKSTRATPGPSFDFPSSDQSVRCTHVSFVLNGVSTSLSPVGVQFSGDVEAPTIHSKEFK